MKRSTRIEVFDRESVVAMPLRLPRIFIPHLVLLGVIAVLWAGDGLYQLGAWVVSGI